MAGFSERLLKYAMLLQKKSRSQSYGRVLRKAFAICNVGSEVTRSQTHGRVLRKAFAVCNIASKMARSQ